MSTIINGVNNQNKIINAEFVKITITTSTSEVIAMSTAYKNETFGGTTYTALGGLVGISTQQRDLRVSGYDTSVTLIGIDPANMNMVLGKQIRGAELEIHRGFYNESYVLQTTAKRFTGIITSFTVQEQREENTDMFVISVNASNYKTVLENNVGGRRTSKDTWDYWYGSDDISMDNVAALNGAFFDFGVPVK
jgi:hypothetical protein